MSRLLGFGRNNRNKKLSLWTRFKHKLSPEFMHKQVVMPDGSIVNRPALSARLKESLSSPKTFLREKLKNYL